MEGKRGKDREVKANLFFSHAGGVALWMEMALVGQSS